VILAERAGAPVRYCGVAEALEERDTRVLLFGKPEARPQRRMGVALARAGSEEEARARADRAAGQVRVLAD
jgi:phosphoribosylglycinamide formyltransferase 2